MNLTCEISSTNESNSSACTNTEDDNVFKIELILSILTILMIFPTNSYVIQLIVTGTGNGLEAEFFILNFSICEIFHCVQCVFIALCYKFDILLGVTYFMEGFPITGRSLFECLMCVERYLAVIHPVTFLKYKPLRYRLMCAAVVWIASIFSCIFNCMLGFYSLLLLYLIFDLVQFLVFLSVQLFCCLAVLRALKQSGPGERGREREEENHRKRRAFHLILITSVTTVIINAPQIPLTLLVLSSKQHVILKPVSYLFFIFVGLVQPLLFLYRVGKLNFVKEGMKSR